MAVLIDFPYFKNSVYINLLDYRRAANGNSDSVR